MLVHYHVSLLSRLIPEHKSFVSQVYKAKIFTSEKWWDHKKKAMSIKFRLNFLLQSQMIKRFDWKPLEHLLKIKKIMLLQGFWFDMNTFLNFCTIYYYVIFLKYEPLWNFDRSKVCYFTAITWVNAGNHHNFGMFFKSKFTSKPWNPPSPPFWHVCIHYFVNESNFRVGIPWVFIFNMWQ